MGWSDMLKAAHPKFHQLSDASRAGPPEMPESRYFVKFIMPVLMFAPPVWTGQVLKIKHLLPKWCFYYVHWGDFLYLLWSLLFKAQPSKSMCWFLLLWKFLKKKNKKKEVVVSRVVLTDPRGQRKDLKQCRWRVSLPTKQKSIIKNTLLMNMLVNCTEINLFLSFFLGGWFILLSVAQGHFSRTWHVFTGGSLWSPFFTARVHCLNVRH